jgi:hypothetical protein
MKSKKTSLNIIRTRNAIMSNIDSEQLNTTSGLTTTGNKSMSRGSNLIEEARLRQSKFQDRFQNKKAIFNPNQTQGTAKDANSVEQFIGNTQVG